MDRADAQTSIPHFPSARNQRHFDNSRWLCRCPLTSNPYFLNQNQDCPLPQNARLKQDLPRPGLSLIEELCNTGSRRPLQKTLLPSRPKAAPCSSDGRLNGSVTIRQPKPRKSPSASAARRASTLHRPQTGRLLRCPAEKPVPSAAQSTHASRVQPRGHRASAQHPRTQTYFKTELSFIAIAVEPFTFSLPVMKAMVGSSLPA